MSSSEPAGHPRVLDLRPAAGQLAALVTDLSDADLGRPTPCDCTVSALLTHVVGLTAAFTAAARKEVDRGGSPPGDMPDALPGGWREDLPQQLTELAAAWREPSAWQGTARAGGIEMPAAEAGVVALDELVLHTWDVAVATGRTHRPDTASVAAVAGFVEAVPADPAARQGLFGPPLPVPQAATTFERVLALAGRDPRWRA